LRAYSSGTGVVIGMTNAAATVAAVGRLKRSTTVRSSGVWMPGIRSTPFDGACGAPRMAPKYEVA
jgi:hypothetical protein